MGFRVMARQCASCIYRASSPLDLRTLEDEVRNEAGFLEGWRVCHSAEDGSESTGPCCRGFWNEHKDAFPVGQVAQRLGAVDFVDGGSRP